MIRQAGPLDDEWIAALWSEIIAQPHITFTTLPKSAADIAALRRSAPLLVSGAVGFASFGPFRGGPGYAKCAEISVHVAADARGQGHGAALLVALEDAAAARGIDVLMAGISGANPGAVRFHAARGYREVGRLPGIGVKAGARHDLVLMQKILRAHPDFAPAAG